MDKQGILKRAKKDPVFRKKIIAKLQKVDPELRLGYLLRTTVSSYLEAFKDQLKGYLNFYGYTALVGATNADLTLSTPSRHAIVRLSWEISDTSIYRLEFKLLLTFQDERKAYKNEFVINSSDFSARALSKGVAQKIQRAVEESRKG